MARWSRAARLLPAGARRVLDLGCAWGFGTRSLTPGRYVVGVDVSEAYIRRAARTVKNARFLRALADRVPLRDGSFDAIACLDVLEHVPDERALLAEVHRLLRPGGVLLISVPHRGTLARFDSIDLLPELWDMNVIAPARDLSTERGEIHRHYSLAELRALLGDGFRITGVWRTGLGIAELVNIPLLLLCHRLLRAPWLYQALQYIYFTVYLAEDNLPMGRNGYHMMVRAVSFQPSAVSYHRSGRHGESSQRRLR